MIRRVCFKQTILLVLFQPLKVWNRWYKNVKPTPYYELAHGIYYKRKKYFHFFSIASDIPFISKRRFNYRCRSYTWSQVTEKCHRVREKYKIVETCSFQHMIRIAFMNADSENCFIVCFFSHPLKLCVVRFEAYASKRIVRNNFHLRHKRSLRIDSNEKNYEPVAVRVKFALPTMTYQ